LLLASVFVGSAFGAPLFGWLADRHGRRMALGTSPLIDGDVGARRYEHVP
jgi:MFS family permease